MFGALLCMAQRPENQEYRRKKIFGKFRNVVLEENREDKIIRKSDNEKFLNV